jgi:hypothetical protein
LASYSSTVRVGTDKRARNDSDIDPRNIDVVRRYKTPQCTGTAMKE